MSNFIWIFDIGWEESQKKTKTSQSLLTTTKMTAFYGDIVSNWHFCEWRNAVILKTRNSLIRQSDLAQESNDNDITHNESSQLNGFNQWWKSDFEWDASCCMRSLFQIRNRTLKSARRMTKKKHKLKFMYFFLLGMTNGFAVGIKHKTRIFTRMMWSFDARLAPFTKYRQKKK